MTLKTGDTIAAIATAQGAGGIGVIRISGPESYKILKEIFKPVKKHEDKKHGLLEPGWIVEKAADKNKQVLTKLDFGMAVFFKSPHSYTGEDTVELQVHGGMLNLRQILNLVIKTGTRPANPGEFTMRAFLNGQIDLARAEAVREFIESQTTAALSASRRHLEGDVSRLCQDLRYQMIDAMAHIEAYIDFPEEELSTDDRDNYKNLFINIRELIEKTASSYNRGRLLHDGLEVMIVGRPNVGKSSLLNSIMGVERAIVTDIPGTTRDMIEGLIDIKGVPVRFVDSAGLRDTETSVESIGVDRALKRLKTTDFVIFMLDGSMELTESDKELQSLFENRKGLMVINKSDLDQNLDISKALKLAPHFKQINISAKTGSGIDLLEDNLGELIAAPENAADELILTSSRQHACFIKALDSIDRAITGIDDHEMPLELLAADLRESLDHLEDVIGATAPDDVLNEIFSKFCIGK